MDSTDKEILLNEIDEFYSRPDATIARYQSCTLLANTLGRFGSAEGTLGLRQIVKEQQAVFVLNFAKEHSIGEEHKFKLNAIKSSAWFVARLAEFMKSEHRMFIGKESTEALVYTRRAWLRHLREYVEKNE